LSVLARKTKTLSTLPQGLDLDAGNAKLIKKELAKTKESIGDNCRKISLWPSLSIIEWNTRVPCHSDNFEAYTLGKKSERPSREEVKVFRRRYVGISYSKKSIYAFVSRHSNNKKSSWTEQFVGIGEPSRWIKCVLKFL
jgi:hypothetical protein